MTKPGKRALHAYVSESAHELWHDFGREQGVSVSAVLEVIALELNFEGRVSPPSMGIGLEDVVKRARLVDYDRRRRR